MKKNIKPELSVRSHGPLSRFFAIESARDRAKTISFEASLAERQALAEFLHLPGIGALAASFEINPLSGGRYGVRGEVEARVTQTCVVSLEEFETALSEKIEAVFAPEVRADDEEMVTRRTRVDVSFDAGNLSFDAEKEAPDAIVDGGIDLGALASEYLALALDPYPRKPDVVFGELRDALDADDPSPFAALARLQPGAKREKNE